MAIMESQDTPDLLVIDPISAYLGKTDSFKDAPVRALLAPLAAFAAKHDLAVLAVMHLTKADDRRAITRANGSIAFVGAARIVLMVGEDPKAQEGNEKSDRRFLVAVKSNLGGKARTLA